MEDEPDDARGGATGGPYDWLVFAGRFSTAGSKRGMDATSHSSGSHKRTRTRRANVVDVAEGSGLGDGAWWAFWSDCGRSVSDFSVPDGSSRRKPDTSARDSIPEVCARCVCYQGFKGVDAVVQAESSTTSTHSSVVFMAAVPSKSRRAVLSSQSRVNPFVTPVPIAAEKGAEPLLPVNAALAPAFKLGCCGDVCVYLWVVCMCAILWLRSTESLSTPV